MRCTKVAATVAVAASLVSPLACTPALAEAADGAAVTAAAPNPTEEDAVTAEASPVTPETEAPETVAAPDPTTDDAQGSQAQNDVTTTAEPSTSDEAQEEAPATTDAAQPADEASNGGDASGTYNGLKWEADSTNTVQITGYTGSPRSVVIPNSINGKPVTSIRYEAFKNCISLQSLTLPENLAKINWNTFENCTGLTSITVKSRNLKGYADSFEGAGANSGITVTFASSCQKIPEDMFATSDGAVAPLVTKVVVSSSVKEIGQSAFRNCSSLASVSFTGSGLRTIDASAFKGCTSLKSISFPSSLAEIGNDSFSGTGLTSLTLPENLQSIGFWGFSYCTDLKTLTVKSRNLSVSGVFFTSPFKGSGVSSGMDVTFEAPCSSISPNFFNTDSSSERVRVRSIKISSSVTSIGGYAFSKTYGLQSVTIPSSVTDISSSAFDGAKNVTIYGYRGSRAESYANEHKIKFVALRGSDPAGKTQVMHRLYNPNSGEHFYTASDEEKGTLVRAGWRSEGEGWVAPTTGDPVYRMYNPNAGDHHYTTSASERDDLVRAGWHYEGIGWYSGGSKKVYRQYNPNAQTGSHNYTTSAEERDTLVAAGWRDEGVGWYAVR